MENVISRSWLGARTGLDPGALDALRREGRLLGVRKGSTYEFPSWQFGPDGRPLPALQRVIAVARAARISDERLAQLLGARAGLRSERRLADSLREGNIEHVLAVIQAARAE